MRKNAKKNKRLLTAIVVVLSQQLLFSQNYLSCDILNSLPSFAEAELLRQKSMLDLRSDRSFFLPNITLSSGAQLKGSFEDDSSNIVFTPELTFFQNLPFLASMELGVKGSMCKNEGDEMMYAFTPSASLTLPLLVTPELLSAYCRSFAGEYKSKKKSVDLDYRIALESSAGKYVSAVGNYLYYRELELLYIEKERLLALRSSDYEKLFSLGKVTALDVSEKVSDLLNFYQEQVVVRGKIISSEKELMELGIEPGKISCAFSGFLAAWGQYYRKRGTECFFQEEKELVSLDAVSFSGIKKYASRIPTVSGGFSFATPYGSDEFPDVSLSSWTFSLDVTLPVSEGLGISSISALIKQQDLVSIEKQKIYRRKESLSRERKNYISLYESYAATMRNAAEVEKKRLNSYEELLRIGRLSEFDLSMQKNAHALSNLQALYADFQTLLALASFY